MGLPVPYMPVPARRASTAESNCPQCGGPHDAHASVCLYCLTPKAGATESSASLYACNAVHIEAERRITGLIDVTTLEDDQPRYVPAYPQGALRD
jgi:hypothetical protein